MRPWMRPPSVLSRHYILAVKNNRPSLYAQLGGGVGEVDDALGG
jgi:hypothetical protein